MALTETTTLDRIEIVGPTRSVHVRYSVVIENDGEFVAKNSRVDYLQSGELDENDSLVDTDLSSQPQEIQGICAAVWTDEIKELYRQELVQSRPPVTPE